MVLGEHAADDVLVELDVEHKRELFRDSLADFRSRARLMKVAQTAAIARSIGRKFGARSRERLRTMSCCLSSSDSAMTARTPPGRKHLASVAIR